MVSLAHPAQLPFHVAIGVVMWPGVQLLSLEDFCVRMTCIEACMSAAEKETPYSLRTQIFLSVQSASLVLDGPNSEQASYSHIAFIS